MDFLDTVLQIEEKAFQEGLEDGKVRAREIAEKESRELGKENGFFIAREYGFIIGFTEVVNMEEHIREKHLKTIQEILDVHIEPTMPDHEINSKMLKLRSLFKVLLSQVKITLQYSTETDLF
jgi:alanyl-tRNA synthetase